MTNVNAFESHYSKDTVQKLLIYFLMSLNGTPLLLGRMSKNYSSFRNSTAEFSQQAKFQVSQA